MNYNDGLVHMEFYDQPEDLEKIANDFSEGDDKLKNTLLSLWKNSIKTTACCRGHDDENPPYISFAINENSKNLIELTTEYLYLQNGEIELDFTCNSNKDYDTFTVHMSNENEKEDYLNLINSFLTQKTNHDENKNNIPKYGYYLLKFARRMGINCRFSINKDGMMFGFYRPGTILLFDENSPVLDDIIESIKETGNIPLSSFKCSNNSLQEFINLLYPNTFMIQGNIQR